MISVEWLVLSPACGLVENLPSKIAVPEGTTLAEAMQTLAVQQGWSQAWLDEQWQRRAIAVFGQRGEPDDVLVDGDRIECLPPLLLDPKERRRRQALEKSKLS